MALLATALLIALLAAPSAALAAPDRTKAFETTDAFAWDGPTVSGFSPTPVGSLAPAFLGAACQNPVPLGPHCDTTLIELKAPGTLSITIGGFNQDSDLDLYLRRSDETGTYGDEAAPAPVVAGPFPEKIVAANLPPGFYLVAVNYFYAMQTSYAGTASFAPAQAAAPTAPAPEPPVPGQPQGDPGALPVAGSLSARVRLANRGVRAPSASVECTVVCKVSLQLLVGAKTAQKLGLGRRRNVIGRAASTIHRKQPPPIAIRLTPKAKKGIRKVKSFNGVLKAVVTDSGGGQKTSFRSRAKLTK